MFVAEIDEIHRYVAAVAIYYQQTPLVQCFVLCASVEHLLKPG